MSCRSSCTAALLGVLLAACGETRVTLLPPSQDHAAGSTAVAAASAAGGVGAGSDAATPPASNTTHLVHRYSFAGDGTRVVDSVGSADGSLENGAVLDGAGHVSLDGVDDYVNLPNGLLS